MLAALIAAILDIMRYWARAWMFLVKELPVVKSNPNDPNRRNQRLLPVEAESQSG